MRSHSSLLGLAASLEATAAELAAKAALIRASLEDTTNDAPRDTVTLADAVRLLGNKRRAREFFRRAERAGFAVTRVGHAVTMDRAEWDRACKSMTPKRKQLTGDALLDALLAQAGASGAPPKRAA